MKVALQKLQIARLSETYADLRAEERYADLAQFFFVDLYYVGDRAERNESFLRLWKHFEKILGRVIVQGLTDLVDFYMLSEKLDEACAKMLLRLRSPLAITTAQYEQAHRYCDNYDERVVQLEFVARTLNFVHATSQRRLFGVLISTMQATARLIGASQMVDFLDRGYTAFRGVKDITYFRETIRKREQERLDRIWRDVPLDKTFAS